MAFNSLGFLIFLPISLVAYYLLLHFRLTRWICPLLILVSLLFYAAGSPRSVPLLLLSIAGNYLCARLIELWKDDKHRKSAVLSLGVVANVAVLCWYKYSGFFLNNVNALAGTDFRIEHAFLPLAISFFTFQQIAFLVDTSRGQTTRGSIWEYATFVLYFPRIISGPIVHYRDIMPQILGRYPGRFWRADLVVGLTIFAIGLFKKTVIADNAGSFAAPVFAAAHAGDPISLLEGWKAAICFTFQLYFDFSGYCDMAVGVSRMFGVLLPPNFHSPLRAASIIEYWRRWHMTLQQFIVSYMYQPLVMPLARFSAARGLDKWPSFWVTVAFPTIVIFVIIGFWHGPSWTFGLFGLMHGIYLAINEFWRAWRRKARRKTPPDTWSVIFYHVLTLLCVAMANVMFRAADPADAVRIWTGMLSLHQIGSVVSVPPVSVTQIFGDPFALIVFATLIVALMPNANQLMTRYRPVLDWSRWKDVDPSAIRLVWRPTPAWAIAIGVVLFFGMIFILSGEVQFIYANF